MAATWTFGRDHRRTSQVQDGELSCEACVEASFDVPRWVPVPLKAIQDGGQKAIAKQVEQDVGSMVENLLKNDPGDVFDGDGGGI